MARNEEIIQRLLEKANSLPLLPGVYVMKDRTGKIVYVGKSRKLKNRVSQYFQNSKKTPKTEKMVESVFDFEYYLCDTEIEALTLENSLIKQHTPKYNIKLKDAKSYPYIKITEGQYPRLVMARKREGDRGTYFGPFSSTSTVYSVISAINKALMLPSCKKSFPRDIKKERPCLYYRMGRCMGVCTGNITSEEYKQILKPAYDILRGNTTGAKRELTAEMEKAAEEERFETAAKYRDTIIALDKLSQKQHMVSSPEDERDVISYYSDDTASCITFFYIREGALVDRSEFLFGADEIIDEESLSSFICEHYRIREYIPREILMSFRLDAEDTQVLEELLSEKAGRRVHLRTPERGDLKTLCETVSSNAAESAKRYKEEGLKDEGVLVRLSELLGLEVLPERIEAYDISNLGDEHITAGMVVSENGKLKKSDYRVFKIKSTDTADDYTSMAETLTRRLSHLSDGTGSFSVIPDLILLDGGKGHVAVVKKVLHSMGLDIPVFGMVKDDYHKTRALCTDEEEISIARERGVYMLIYKLQEEVHRFTVSKMDQSKRKTLTHSTLTRIKGIGDSKAKILLSSLGSLNAVKNASPEVLSKISGISQKDAQNIYAYYHKEND